MYYLFKLGNMSEASLFFAYGSKGQPLCLNSKVAFKYVSLNWNYIMLAMGLLLSALEGKWKRLWSWPRAETQDKSHNSHTHTLPAAVTSFCLANLSLFSKPHLKSSFNAFSRQVLYQDCTGLGFMTFNMMAPSLISHLMWTSGPVISAQACQEVHGTVGCPIYHFKLNVGVYKRFFTATLCFLNLHLCGLGSP